MLVQQYARSLKMTESEISSDIDDLKRDDAEAYLFIHGALEAMKVMRNHFLAEIERQKSIVREYENQFGALPTEEEIDEENQRDYEEEQRLDSWREEREREKD